MSSIVRQMALDPESGDIGPGRIPARAGEKGRGC